MNKNLSLPLLQITFKVNDLQTEINKIEMSDIDRSILTTLISRIHDKIVDADNMRKDIALELFSLANAITKNH